ncbi:MAG: NTP transferase domain-containing protein [Sebaldella sp.]|nr:NTP transferase domain-containing protein [Sebaldella sp.]
MKISAVIMASGFSKRMGENKLLLKYMGMSFIENTIKKVLESGFYEINLVTSHNEIENIYRNLLETNGFKKEKNHNFIITKNHNPDKGISESIKLGVKNLKPCDAYMFFTADQPKLSTETIKYIMSKAEIDKIIIPKYNNENGSPTIFGGNFKDNLLYLEGDTGGKQIVQENKGKVKYLDIKNVEEGIDIDTQEEYRKLIGKL